MKTGIFGGTFNPIHNGHIQLCDYCKTEAGLDRIILIPTYTPPHKANAGLADARHRLNMCRIACKRRPDYQTSDIEIKRGGKSYTCDTLTYLKELYPDDELYLIMGADMFLTLNKWKNPDVIYSKAKIITVPRGESDFADLSDYYINTLIPSGAEAVILQKPVLSVSSTYIRDNIADRALIEPLIDGKVLDYIASNNLYRK